VVYSQSVVFHREIFSHRQSDVRSSSSRHNLDANAPIDHSLHVRQSVCIYCMILSDPLTVYTHTDATLSNAVSLDLFLLSCVMLDV
jgi:hypothetical protein